MSSNEKMKPIITGERKKARLKVLKAIHSLHAAAKDNKIETVEWLIKEGFDVNKPNSKGVTPLHVAAQYGHHKMVKSLIKNGAHIDCLMKGGAKFTPLHFAVKENHLECARVLIRYGAKFSFGNPYVFHPIQIAILNNRVEIADLLFDYGVNVNFQFRDDFLSAFEYELPHTLWQFHCLPLLHYAILKNFKNMTKLLLDRGADVYSKTRKGTTTLMQAVVANDFDLVRFLVTQKGLGVNDRDDSGQPVLHYTTLSPTKMRTMNGIRDTTSISQTIFIIRFLLQNGADVNAQFPVVDGKCYSVINYMIDYLFVEEVHELLYCSDLDFNLISYDQIFNSRMLNWYPHDIHQDASIEQRYKTIIFYIVQRAIELDMIGVPVDSKFFNGIPTNRPIFTAEEYNQVVNSLKNRIQGQINYMKETKISDDSNVTIWHMLTCEMKTLIKFMSSEDVKNFNAFENYPNSKIFNYCHILGKRLWCAKKKRLELEKSVEYIFNLFINQLPYDCCEKIFNFFNDQELKSFVSVNGLIKC